MSRINHKDDFRLGQAGELEGTVGGDNRFETRAGGASLIDVDSAREQRVVGAEFPNAPSEYGTAKREQNVCRLAGLLGNNYLCSPAFDITVGHRDSVRTRIELDEGTPGPVCC